MREALDAYLEHLRRERQVSPHTLAAYQRDLLKLLPLAEQDGLQTWNELELERERWNNTALAGMRFVAPPEGTEVRERKPGLAMGIALGGVLGGMLGVMIALVRAWWRGSREGEAGISTKV